MNDKEQKNENQKLNKKHSLSLEELRKQMSKMDGQVLNYYGLNNKSDDMSISADEQAKRLVSVLYLQELAKLTGESLKTPWEVKKELRAKLYRQEPYDDLLGRFLAYSLTKIRFVQVDDVPLDQADENNFAIELFVALKDNEKVQIVQGQRVSCDVLNKILDVNDIYGLSLDEIKDLIKNGTDEISIESLGKKIYFKAELFKAANDVYIIDPDEIDRI